MLDLIIKNGECYINGNLEKKDIGILKRKIVEIENLKDKSKEKDYLVLTDVAVDVKNIIAGGPVPKHIKPIWPLKLVHYS